jgi:hypothetical protein
MSKLNASARMPLRVARLSAIASLLGAAVLAGPLAASAQTAPTTPATVHHYHHTMHRMAAVTRETINARIAMLHEKLAITLDEEPKWAAVAQVMRDNETVMHRMIADRAAAGAHDVTAVEDLKTYEHFSQAHLDGLKNLIDSFETLYAVMPASQQAVADHVFMRFGDRAHALRI